MAPGGDWDAQKMLDLYIHDYMVRKKFLTAAEIFADEANVGAGPIVSDGPDGFLKEWWHMFWDKYSSGVPDKHLEAIEGSSVVKATQVMGNEQLSHFPAVPSPDMNQERQMQFQGKSEACLFAATMYEGEHGELPSGELNSNQQLVRADNLVHSGPSSSNASNFQLQTHAGDEQCIGGDNYGAQMGGPSPVGSTVNGAGANMPRARPPDAGSRKSAKSVALHGWPLTGMGRIPSGMEYPVLNSFVPVPNQRQSQFQKLIPHHQQKNSSQAMVNKNARKISDFQGSTGSFGNQMFPKDGPCRTDGQMIMRHMAERQVMVPNKPTIERKMIIPNPMKQAVKQKMAGPVRVSFEHKQNRQSRLKLREKTRKRKNSLNKDMASNGKMVEVKKSSVDDIESLLSPGNENADVVSTSFSNLETHATTCSLTEQNGFFFEEVAFLDAGKGKILCCHFSSDGKLLASAGDDKKVLLWDMNRYNWVESAEGHLDIITDVRFKPSSRVFATSSFDRTVQIWDPNNPSKPLGKLLGHSGQVNSFDFHLDGDLLCSCDSNDEIKLWSIDQFSCKHTFKGATRQVRFQPRCGTLLAAASGNAVNLFDVETNTLQYSLEGHAEEVKSICWDTSGKYMASVSEGSARMWSIVYGGKCIQELKSNGNKFESCIFHPGYSNVLVIGSNQSLELWNSIESKKTLTVPAHNSVVAVLADCTETEMIASASHEGLKLWK